MTTVFVAGSRNLGRLNDEVRKRLSNLISEDFRILVGDANGADKAVQKYLVENAYEKVVVYCSGNRCRNNLGSWTASFVSVDKSKKGREFYAEKDKKMAEDADYGLMIWDGKSAGTLNNVLELLKRNKKTLIYFSPSREFLSVSEPSQITSLLKRCPPEAVEKIRKKVRFGSVVQNEGQKALDF